MHRYSTWAIDRCRVTVALLDASMLYPAPLRDLLIEPAESDLYARSELEPRTAGSTLASPSGVKEPG